MFKNTYQSGLLSVFYSCGSNPLAIWEMEVNNGHIKRVTDTEVSSIVLEIVSTNVATTYISCPRGNQVLGIKLPFLVMIVKNMKRYFSFEITVLDDKNMRRRFRISNFQSTTKIKPFCTSMPIGLSGGWNQIQFNLADFTRRAYGSSYVEALRIQIHANTRLRRIYFSDRLYSEEELPQDYKLYLPLERKLKKSTEAVKEADKRKVSAPIPFKNLQPTKEETEPPEEKPQPRVSVAKMSEAETGTPTAGGGTPAEVEAETEGGKEEGAGEATPAEGEVVEEQVAPEAGEGEEAAVEGGEEVVNEGGEEAVAEHATEAKGEETVAEEATPEGAPAEEPPAEG